MRVVQVPALTDNYIYILHDDALSLTLVIDPAQANSVIQTCRNTNWTVDGVLITHHHPDHIDGVAEIVALYNCPTFGFAKDSYRLPPLTNTVEDNTSFFIKNLEIQAHHTPGHTLGHMCYFFPKVNYLFCGDTLFSMGCGRLFEGTPEMMLKSLKWIRNLPENTQIYCSHEYTQVNTEFALRFEPNNTQLQNFYQDVLAKRQKHTPTVPFSLKEEKALNPMLRWDDPALRLALGLKTATDLEVFTTVRKNRNTFTAGQY